jgi:hypothetical protein
LASLNHIKPRQHRLPMAKPCTRLNLSQEVLGDDYFFFFLLVVFFAFFAFFAFLATLPSAIPRLVHCKSTVDVHKHRVHHNCKIDTARFEEGKRRSHRRVLQVSEPLSCRQDTWTRLIAQLENIRDEIDTEPCRQWQAFGGDAILLGAIACALIRVHVMFVATLSGSR